MRTHAEKKQGNKNQLETGDVSKSQKVGVSGFQFEDNHPETAAQRKLQTTANNSHQILQLSALQEMANKSPAVKQSAGLQEMANNYSAQQQRPIRKKENNTGLPDKLKSGIEYLSGYSMDEVNVHYNSDKPAQLNAHAFAQGTDIYLASKQEKHLPHEAWHVVQQKQGRVKPTLQMKGKVNINDDIGLEKEASIMGTKAMQSTPEIEINNQYRSKDQSTAKTNYSIQGGNKPAVPTSHNIVQRIRKEEVEEVIGDPGQSRAKNSIVDYLTTLPANDTGPNAKANVKSRAKKMGYSEEGAERLVTQNPFTVNDFNEYSQVDHGGSGVQSFTGITPDSGTGDKALHRLYFHNIFDNGVWKMKENYRNPYLASFYGNQAVEAQKEFLEGQGGHEDNSGLEKILRVNVVSESGIAWKRKYKINNGKLWPHQFLAFMKTQNGKQSERIANDQRLTCVSGIVSKVEEGSDDYFDVELTCKPLGRNPWRRSKIG